jgi:NAD(P)-dependent dehydrogenase (short-subunit alcohol dehydrogenase family)
MNRPPTHALDGRATIVTGAASGIGRAASHLFAAAGARLLLVDRDEAALAATVAEIDAQGGEVAASVADVSDGAQVERAVAAAVERYGRLDCAFNNAGVDSFQWELAELPEEEWRRVIDVDLTGVFLCMKHEIRAMRAGGGGGAIVNTSSGLGLVAIANQSAYIAAKHGVLGLTKAAALENATSGLRINAICPGIIRTPMAERGIAGNPAVADALASSQPIGRLGEPEEVAAAALFLLSDAASFITGEGLAVDGGYLAK